ncbi:MAG TPA: LuxR C-terminal-related transcriptional regulator [Planctomycetota bacterium]|nr:LuxR C-terminal-related transcriptional regulator [Planctomycetota bacterium]
MNRNEQIAGVLLDAFTHSDINAARQQLTAGLGRLMNATVAHLREMNAYLRKEPELQYFSGATDSVRNMLAMQQYYAWKNPLIPHLKKQQNSVFRNYEVVGEKAWFESEFYIDYLYAAAKLTDCVALFGPSSAQRFWAIGFGHPKKGFFKRDDFRFLHSIAPAMQRGLACLDRWEALKFDADALEEGTAEALAVLRVEGSGRLALATATRPARQALGIDTVPISRNKHAQEFIALAARAIGAVGENIVWQAHDGRRFGLNAQRRTNAAGSSVLVVRLLPIGVQIARDEDRALARKAGLTEREASVFALIATGLGNREIAQKLGVSPHTVNAHIQNLFGKLGASNRVEAINAVRRVP